MQRDINIKVPLSLQTLPNSIRSNAGVCNLEVLVLRFRFKDPCGNMASTLYCSCFRVLDLGEAFQLNMFSVDIAGTELMNKFRFSNYL